MDNFDKMINDLKNKLNNKAKTGERRSSPIKATGRPAKKKEIPKKELVKYFMTSWKERLEGVTDNREVAEYIAGKLVSNEITVIRPLEKSIN